MTNVNLDDLLDHAGDPAGGGPDAEELDDEFGKPAGRRRIPRLTAALVCGIAVGLAFTGGVLVQKHWATNPTTGTGPAAGGFPSGFPAGGLGGGAGNTGSQGTGATGGASTVPALVGTVVKVTPEEVTVEDLGGTRHVVRIGDATSVTTVTKVDVSKLTKGQSVTVDGTKATDGSVDATSVTGR